MKRLIPVDDNVIVKIIPVEEKIGAIIIAGDVKEKSTLCEVLIPATESYYRDGTLRPQPRFKAGQLVRIPTGNVGTGVPEAPKGEEWLCLPEDSIYYGITEV